MDTVEMIIYIFLAVIIGGLIIAFIAGWDATSTYDGMKAFFIGSEPAAYEQITSDQLPRVVLQVWDACGLGTAEFEKSVYVSNDAPLNSTFIFDAVKEASLCKSLQSASEGCGTREDLLFGSVAMGILRGPVVLVLRCDPATRQLIIT